MSLTIPAYAPGRIDVFALDLDAALAESFAAANPASDDPQASWPLRAALGADFLDPEGVELVRLADLSGLGLAGYLTDGWGAKPAEVAAVRPALDALTGHAVLLRARAYGGLAQTLTPRAPLTHIATLTEVAAAAPGPAVTAESAERTAEAPDAAPPAPDGSGTPLPVIAGGLIAAAVLVLVLSLSLGG